MKNRLKKLCAFVSVIAVAATVFAPTFSTWAANGTTYYVDASVKSTGDGSKGSPFKTINEAVAKAAAGDTVIIADGSYCEDVTFSIAGTEEKPVLFKAEKGDKANVIIDGADKVTETWVKQPDFKIADGTVKGDVWKVKSEMKMGDRNQLFIDDEMQFLAQWPNRDDTQPNIGLKLMKPIFSQIQEGSNTTKIVDDKLPNVNLTGAELWYRGSVGWVGWSSPILTSDPGKSFTFEDHSPYAEDRVAYNRNSPHDYYVSNSKDLLDIPGEWYYDKDKKELYLCVETGKDPNKMNIRKKARSTSLIFENASYVTLENIDLFATSMNIKSTANNCTIDGMTALYLNHTLDSNNPGDPIGIDGDDNAIWNSEIAYVFGGGIVTRGKRAKIMNCKLHDIGYGKTGGGFISLYGEDDIVFHNTGYNAKSAMLGGSGRGTRVAYNHLYNSGMLTNDCGLMYFGGTDGGMMEIDHNFVHHNVTDNNSMGIYFDIGSQNYTIHHNLIYNVNTYGFSMNVPAVNMLVFNNTIYDTAGVMNDFAAQDRHNGNNIPNYYVNDGNGSQFVNNIVAYNRPKDKYGSFCPVGLVDGVMVDKTNIVTNRGEEDRSKYGSPRAPKGYVPEKAEYLFKDVDADALAKLDGFNVPADYAEKFVLAQANSGKNAEENEQIAMARTGGTPVRNVSGDGGSAYIGCFDPDKEAWQAGHTGHSGAAGEKLNRNDKVFYVNGKKELGVALNLDHPRSDVQYENKVYNGSFEGGYSGWSDEETLGRTGFIKNSTLGALLYGKGSVRGREDSRSSQKALRLGRGMDGVRQTVTELRENTQYALSAWIKMPDDTQIAAFGVENYDGKGGALECKLSWDTIPVVNDTKLGKVKDVWQRYEIRFTTGSNKSVDIYLRTLAQNGKFVYFDDITVQEVSSSENFNDGEWNELLSKDNGGTITYNKYSDNASANTNTYVKTGEPKKFNIANPGTEFEMTFKAKYAVTDGTSYMHFRSNGDNVKDTSFMAVTKDQLRFGNKYDADTTKAVTKTFEIKDLKFKPTEWNEYKITSEAAKVTWLVKNAAGEWQELYSVTNPDNLGHGTNITVETYKNTAVAYYDDIVITPKSGAQIIQNFEKGGSNWGSAGKWFSYVTEEIKEDPPAASAKHVKISEGGKFKVAEAAQKLSMTYKAKYNLKGNNTESSWRVRAGKYNGDGDCVAVRVYNYDGNRIVIESEKDKRKSSLLKEENIPAKVGDTSFSLADWHEYKIDVTENSVTLSVKVDGKYVELSKLDATAEQLPSFGSGKDICLKNYLAKDGALAAEYDNIVITPAEGTAVTEDFEDGKWNTVTDSKAKFEIVEELIEPEEEEDKPSADEGKGDGPNDKYALLASENGANFVFASGAKEPTVSFKSKVEAGSELTLKLRQNDAFTSGVRVVFTQADNKVTLYSGDKKFADSADKAKTLAEWHNYRVELSGKTIKVYQDNILVLEKEDNSLAGDSKNSAFYVKGSAGLDNLGTALPDTGTKPEKLEYKAPDIGNFKPITPETANPSLNNKWDFENGRISAFEFRSSVAGVTPVGDTSYGDHGRVLKIYYGSWNTVRYLYKFHNGEVSFDGIIDLTSPTGETGYFELSSRLEGESRMSMRIIPGAVVLHKVDLKNTWHDLATVSFDEISKILGKEYKPDEWHRYKYEFDENRYRISIDDKVIINYEDKNIPLYFEDTNMGMRLTRAPFGALIDNFMIRDIESEWAPPVDEPDPEEPENPENPGDDNNGNQGGNNQGGSNNQNGGGVIDTGNNGNGNNSNTNLDNNNNGNSENKPDDTNGGNTEQPGDADNTDKPDKDGNSGQNTDGAAEETDNTMTIIVIIIAGVCVAAFLGALFYWLASQKKNKKQ